MKKYKPTTIKINKNIFISQKYQNSYKFFSLLLMSILYILIIFFNLIVYKFKINK